MYTSIDCHLHIEMDVSPWEGLVPNFLKHVPEINAQLKAAGRAEISVGTKA